MTSPEPAPAAGADDERSRLVLVYQALRDQQQVLEALPSPQAVVLLDQLRACTQSVLQEVVADGAELVRGYVRATAGSLASLSATATAEDLEAVGMVGFQRAVETYDPASGLRFGQWAFKPIQREVLRAVRDSIPDRPLPGADTPEG